MSMVKMTWSEAVRELDGSKCCFCGSIKNLNAHHIKPKSKFPELSNDLNNGITLCRNCHRAAHRGSFNAGGAALTELTVNPDEVIKFIEEYSNNRIILVVPKGKKAVIQAYAEKQGESLNGFVNRAIDEAMEREGSKEQ